MRYNYMRITFFSWSVRFVLLVAASIVGFFSVSYVFAMTPVIPPSTIPVVTSSTHPDQSAWYSSRDIAFSWNVPADVIAVSTRYDEVPDSIPTKVYDPPISEKKFTAESDGVQYFHIQFKTEHGWGDVAHHRFQIDTESPSDISIAFPNGSETTAPSPRVEVKASDELSGIGTIRISVDGRATTTYRVDPSNIYMLPEQKAGKHVARVEVSDKAGNSLHQDIVYTILAIEAPVIDDYTKHTEGRESLLIRGSTYPSSMVQVAYTNVKTYETITSFTYSEDDGTFLFVNPKGIPAGIYEMKVRVVNDEGAESAYTEGRIVAVEDVAAVRFGMFIINWVSLGLIVVIALACLGTLGWYAFTRFSKFQRKTRMAMKEAEHTLKVNVQALRRDVEEFYTLLIKAKEKRSLTREESSMVRKFKKRLDTTERDIEKKLERII